MFTFTLLAVIVASIVAMTVAYNSYGADLVTTISLGLAAGIFVGGGMRIGFVSTPEGMGAIAFGVVLGLVASLARASAQGGNAAFFPVTPHANGQILDISMPSVVCTDKMYTERKAA